MRQTSTVVSSETALVAGSISRIFAGRAKVIRPVRAKSHARMAGHALLGARTRIGPGSTRLTLKARLAEKTAVSVYNCPIWDNFIFDATAFASTIWALRCLCDGMRCRELPQVAHTLIRRRMARQIPETRGGPGMGIHQL